MYNRSAAERAEYDPGAQRPVWLESSKGKSMRTEKQEPGSGQASRPPQSANTGSLET